MGGDPSRFTTGMKVITSCFSKQISHFTKLTSHFTKQTYYLCESNNNQMPFELQLETTLLSTFPVRYMYVPCCNCTLQP